MGGHENFIAAVCVMPPSDKYKQGLIATGGNDHKINVYRLDSPVPEFTLTGHSNTGGHTAGFSIHLIFFSLVYIIAELLSSSWRQVL